MGPLHLCPRHRMQVCRSDSLGLLVFTDIVAIYLGLQMFTAGEPRQMEKSEAHQRFLEVGTEAWFAWSQYPLPLRK